MPFINSPTLCVAIETNSEVTSNGLVLFQTLVVYVRDETYLNDSGWVFTRFPQHPRWNIDRVEVSHNEKIITLFLRDPKSNYERTCTYINIMNSWDDVVTIYKRTVADDFIKKLIALYFPTEDDV